LYVINSSFCAGREGTTSKIVVLGFSALAFVLAVLTSVLWYTIAVDHEAWGARAQVYLIFPVLGGGSLLLAVESVLSHRRRARALDLWSTCMAAAAFLVVLGESAAFYFIPVHGPW
jgi:hypothetical protein